MSEFSLCTLVGKRRDRMKLSGMSPVLVKSFVYNDQTSGNSMSLSVPVKQTSSGGTSDQTSGIVSLRAKEQTSPVCTSEQMSEWV